MPLLTNFKALFNAFLASVGIIIGIYIFWLKHEISTLQNDLTKSQSNYELLMMQINQEKINYNSRLIDAQQSKEIIHTQYKTQYKTIIEWRDNNATKQDCNSSMQYLNSYNF